MRTTLEEYLTERGIFDRLGIDIGQWFSGDEEHLAVASARAVQRIMENRGSEVSVRISGGFVQHDVTLPNLPAPLPAKLVSGGLAHGGRDAVFRSVVVGAEKRISLDTKMLTQSSPNVAAVADYLLRQRSFMVRSPVRARA
jgi:hypothetical protein